MINHKISARYAGSLLDLAEDNNSLEQIFQDAKTIAAALGVSPPLRKVLINPVIKPKTKVLILDEVFSGKISLDTAKFIRFLVEKNREAYLYDIMRKFLELRNEKLGIIDVEVRTAVEFTKEQTELLNKKLESILNKKVNLNFTIDKNILGGFIARVGDTLYDASIINQLMNLKKQLLRVSTF